MLFSIIISCILFSCKKIDTTPAKLHGSNFAEIFFESKTTPSKEVADVIEKLKAQNERNNFVHNLPANCGLPLWDKVVFPKQNNPAQSFGEDGSITTDNVLIPLTVNGYNISTLITGVRISDTSYRIKWYTINDLYNLCHVQNKNIRQAESLLSMFLYMESSVFNKVDFYNIPKDLFPSITGVSQTDSTKHIKLKHKGIIENNNPQTQGLFYEYCFYIPSGECNCNGPCDWDDPCPTMYCTEIFCINIEENPCPTCGGGGGTGGGTGGTGGGDPGGGGGGGNPCPFTGGAWYNLAPTEGNEDPCGPPPPPPPPPVHTPCDEINLKKNDSTFKAKFIELKTKASDTSIHYESGYKVTSSTTGNQYTAINGNANDPEIKLTFNTSEKVTCIMHNHYNSPRQLSVFSTGDLILSYQAMQNTGNFTSSTFSMALTTQLGTSYLMLIEDSTKFAAFTYKYFVVPEDKESNIDMRYIFKGITGGANSNTATNELGFLRLMRDLDMGLALFKPNASFSGYKRLKINTANTGVTEEDCPPAN